MEKRQFGLVLLLVLCAVLPAEAQSPEVMRLYKKFLNQHVYEDMTMGKCTDEIRDRNITDGDTNNCKKLNTFIKADANLVKAVCGTDTRDYRSRQPFKVVNCKLQSGKIWPHCNYGDQDIPPYITRRIIISCDEGWPVHYKGEFKMSKARCLAAD